MFKLRSGALALIGALIGALTLVSASAAAQRKDGPARGNVEGGAAAQIKDYLTLIASDEMEGRDTPSRGLDLTANYATAWELGNRAQRPRVDKKLPAELTEN